MATSTNGYQTADEYAGGYRRDEVRGSSARSQRRTYAQDMQAAQQRAGYSERDLAYAKALEDARRMRTSRETSRQQYGQTASAHDPSLSRAIPRISEDQSGYNGAYQAAGASGNGASGYGASGYGVSSSYETASTQAAASSYASSQATPSSYATSQTNAQRPTAYAIPMENDPRYAAENESQWVESADAQSYQQTEADRYGRSDVPSYDRANAGRYGRYEAEDGQPAPTWQRGPVDARRDRAVDAWQDAGINQEDDDYYYEQEASARRRSRNAVAYADDGDARLRRMMVRWGIVAAVCLTFSWVMSLFNSGSVSSYISFLFVVPLVGGVVVPVVSRIVNVQIPSGMACTAYNAGVCVFTVGAALHGIFDITGTALGLVTALAYIGILLIAVAVAITVVSSFRDDGRYVRA